MCWCVPVIHARPDSDGTIRRRDVHGNCEEIRRPGDQDHNDWLDLFDVFACPKCGQFYRPDEHKVDGEECDE